MLNQYSTVSMVIITKSQQSILREKFPPECQNAQANTNTSLKNLRKKVNVVLVM